MIFVCALLAFAAAMTVTTMPETEAEYRATFAALKEAHGRTYAEGSEEHAMRFSAYKKNIVNIRQLQKASKTATFGLNLFFDVSPEEFQKFKMAPVDVNARREADAAAGLTSCLGGGAMKKRSVDEERVVASLPKEFDWRKKNPPVLTPVKNQEQCGSCWTFSCTESVESAWALKTGKLMELAPQQIVDCNHVCGKEDGMKVCDSGCEGGFPWFALAGLKQEGGQMLAKNYPYTGADGTCKFNRAEIAVPLANANYTCLSGPDSATDSTMMAGLLKQPLSVCVDAASWQYYIEGIIANEGGLVCSTTSLDHAVQAVGYIEKENFFGQKESVYVVRNSWGTSWGDAGFVYLQRGNNECTCGVCNAVTLIDV